MLHFDWRIDVLHIEKVFFFCWFVQLHRFFNLFSEVSVNLVVSGISFALKSFFELFFQSSLLHPVNFFLPSLNWLRRRIFRQRFWFSRI